MGLFKYDITPFFGMNNTLPPKAGRWYKKIGARVNLDQNDPENNYGEVRFFYLSRVAKS